MLRRTIKRIRRCSVPSLSLRVVDLSSHFSLDLNAWLDDSLRNADSCPPAAILVTVCFYLLSRAEECCGSGIGFKLINSSTEVICCAV